MPAQFSAKPSPMLLVKFLVSLALTWLWAGLLAPMGAAQTPQSLETMPLIVESENGTHHFTVEFANDPEERSIGLMFRKEMPEDHGMLFDMGMPVRASFWMKNTDLPLDLIFIKTDGTIANIGTGVPHQISPPVQSRGRVLGVLELNEGTAKKLGIKPGDRVLHPIFNNWDSKKETQPK
ncbi:hypothetical protein JCM17845_09820 [Iodidimonas gelatinilytica]|uniref:DUF192 domain-containing protein n=1 Tax=Iodidimonas gelatinilytica TaxID=1236966 RepID=A0A5A7MZG5_9PROT|nr:DUF192 domain-containing protein [Iodidimonas gelatinilytica]GER00359.1 hypothetical protein JCM17845_09820 [Iodidimonas gelatinilytica]